MKKFMTLMIICVLFTGNANAALSLSTIIPYGLSWKWIRISGNYAIQDIIAMVNSYLWFAIGFFCFLFMIWNGYKLITANGDEKVMSSAKKALVGCTIGIVICLLAYIIVRTTVKLFA